MIDLSATDGLIRWSRCACCSAVVGRRAVSIPVRGVYVVTCGAYYCAAKIGAEAVLSLARGLVARGYE